ncbi:hypothetical protein [Microbacterium paludicola]|uniref:hypothetical protein n=1 Tax=Microbacterium paludicola TaxID=300019 RepID=UPI0011A8ED84|nr:hypothetical protein [Microbacterium paludicola]
MTASPITVPIVHVAGRPGSGANVFADRLVTEHGFIKLTAGELLLGLRRIDRPRARVRLKDVIALQRMGAPLIRPGFHRPNALAERLGFDTADALPHFRRLMQQLAETVPASIGASAWGGALRKRLEELARPDARIVYIGCRMPGERELFRSRGATSVWIALPADLAPALAGSAEDAPGGDDFDELVEDGDTPARLHAAADALAARITTPRICATGHRLGSFQKGDRSGWYCADCPWGSDDLSIGRAGAVHDHDRWVTLATTPPDTQDD